MHDTEIITTYKMIVNNSQFYKVINLVTLTFPFNYNVNIRYMLLLLYKYQFLSNFGRGDDALQRAFRRKIINVKKVTQAYFLVIILV